MNLCPAPALSVVMAVYNGAEHLTECITSILSQTWTDFEFVIVDDASTDTTPKLLSDFAAKDPRVRVLRNAVNKERSYSRNWAMQEARAPLIAVMDADDWAHPQRFAKQLAFMREHPEVTVCGTWLEVYETGDVWQWPCDDAGIRAHLLLNSAIAHPTVMFRKEPVLRLTGGYDVSMPPVEDYALWARLAGHADVHFANVPELLLRYRIYPETVRAAYCTRQQELATDIRRTLLQNLGVTPSVEEMGLHLALGGVSKPATLYELYGCWRWGRMLLAQNARLGQYEQGALRACLRVALDSRVRCHPAHIFLRQLWRAYAPESLRKICRSPQAPLGL